MASRLTRAALAAIAALAACDPPPTTMAEYACPPGGTTLTYRNFGAQFLADNCTTCHAAQDGHRHGAPEAYRLDTLDQVHRYAARIFVRAAATNTSMPPGPLDPPAEARDQLAEWLACGAPE